MNAHQKQMLDFASQQLTGYYIGKHGGIIEVISYMALSYGEWITLKEEYEPILDESDFNEIEDYFNNIKNKE